MYIPLGIANSVSSNFGYDPLDTIQFASQSQFGIIQIYLSEQMVEDAKLMKQLHHDLKAADFSLVYFHLEGYLNQQQVKESYFSKIIQLLEPYEEPKFVIHFDENEGLEEMLDVVGHLSENNGRYYLENYFQGKGKEDAEKNIRKYMALFTLANSQEIHLLPALDLPRFFREDIKFTRDEALQWCFQIINFFGNRQIPILFHWIDVKDRQQDRLSFCPMGEGIIPYEEILNFINKTQPQVEAAILEYEDKINPLKSLIFLDRFFTTKLNNGKKE